MLVRDFVQAVIRPKYVPWVSLLAYLEKERVHQVLSETQEVPPDDETRTLLFKLDEVPGATAQAVIDLVVKLKYRKNAVVLLSAAKKETMGALKPTDPIPDDSELGGDFDVFVRLEK